MTDPRFLPVPNSPYIVLKDDTRLGAWAMEHGTIICERELAELPAVKALAPGDVVLDIGAFIGDTALIFNRQGCEVHAFEPYRDAFDAMRINCPGAIAYNVAVGDGRPMCAAGVFGEDDGNHGTRMTTSGGDVLSLTIDSLSLPRVDFIKIDTEGSEPAVLDGAVETIGRCRPVLLFEVYDSILEMQGYTRYDVLDRVWALGYSISVAIGRAEDDRVDFLAVPL